MFEEVFSSRPIVALEKGLEALALRHRVIANNIANVNTPGFKKSEVSFAGELAAFLEARSGNGPGVGEFQPRLHRILTTNMRPDGNNVDVDAEMAKLAENALLYEASVRQISMKFNLLRTAINEGRR